MENNNLNLQLSVNDNIHIQRRRCIKSRNFSYKLLAIFLILNLYFFIQNVIEETK